VTNGFDETDEIEDRAARLLARVAAQRTQRQVEQPGPGDDPHPGVDDESFALEDESEAAAVDEPEPPSGLQPAEYAETDIEPEKPRSPRRMASPPWQSSTSSMGMEFESIPDSPPQSTDHRSPAAASGELSTHPQSPDHPEPRAAEPAPPAWPPGWPPGLPPLPPPPWGEPPWTPVPGHSREPREPAPQADHHASPGFRLAPPLDEAQIVNRDRNAPESGWRRAVYKITGRRVNPGLSRKERERNELFEHIRQPIVGDFRIAVLSIKGGVGKTTTTLGLGSALATVRTDRVISIDANPDRGTLAERVPDTSTSSTVRDLLRDPNIRRYADVRNHTRMAPSRLEVLASEQDPAVAEIFGETDYRRTVDILRHYYNIILTDCGTGIMHSAMAGVLDLANAIVLVSLPAIDAARSASATLDWLEQHGHGALVREAHVVLTSPKRGAAALKLDKVVEHFDARCRSTHVIPFEPHLAEGADFDFRLLKPATRQAYLELAGAVSEKFLRLG
jgi:MinD-like ATPase involved in chromosome partitioning or flagellar assembly